MNMGSAKFLIVTECKEITVESASQDTLLLMMVHAKLKILNAQCMEPVDAISVLKAIDLMQEDCVNMLMNIVGNSQNKVTV